MISSLLLASRIQDDVEDIYKPLLIKSGCIEFDQSLTSQYSEEALEAKEGIIESWYVAHTEALKARGDLLGAEKEGKVVSSRAEFEDLVELEASPPDLPELQPGVICANMSPPLQMTEAISPVALRRTQSGGQLEQPSVLGKKSDERGHIKIL